MSQSYLLDTNILLALVRGKTLGERIDQAFGLRANLQRQAVSIVTQAELLVIADRHNWSQAKRAALDKALENLVVIPVDGVELVQAYATIAAADRSAPGGARNMGKNDMWIAATALYTGLPLVTTDGDFRFLHNNLLQVIWIDPGQ